MSSPPRYVTDTRPVPEGYCPTCWAARRVIPLRSPACWVCVGTKPKEAEEIELPPRQGSLEMEIP